MPVDTKHPSYVVRGPIWYKCRMCVSGEDAVKGADEDLLPKLEGQNLIEYEAYKKRAMFYGASGRTVDGITGVVFRKDPVVDFPEQRLDWLENISAKGTSFNVLAKNTFRNVMVTGRHGLLLDMPADAGDNVFPYIVTYTAESIINWRTSTEGGREKLILVVLEEQVEEPSLEDPFIVTEVTQYRVLSLQPRADAANTLANANALNDQEALALGVIPSGTLAADLVYVATVWRQVESSDKNGKEWRVIDAYLPRLRGKALNYIPFVFCTPSEVSTAIKDPPILSIVNVNISHYMNSADLEHGRHFTALPTAWAAGFQSTSELKIGSAVAWISEEPGATAGYLEFSGSGLGHLAEGMRSKEDLMAVLGARLLEEPRRAVESADTHQTRMTGEASITAAMAVNVEHALETILKWGAEWMGLPVDDVEVSLNKDYVSIRMDPASVQVLMAALQQGRMSWDAFVWNLERGEWLPEGRTAEEELQLILQQPPMSQEEADDVTPDAASDQMDKGPVDDM